MKAQSIAWSSPDDTCLKTYTTANCITRLPDPCQLIDTLSFTSIIPAVYYRPALHPLNPPAIKPNTTNDQHQSIRIMLHIHTQKNTHTLNNHKSAFVTVFQCTSLSVKLPRAVRCELVKLVQWVVYWDVKKEQKHTQPNSRLITFL